MMVQVYSVLNHLTATGSEYHESGVQRLWPGTAWEKWGWKEVDGFERYFEAQI